jgi:hypothetical protein
VKTQNAIPESHQANKLKKYLQHDEITPLTTAAQLRSLEELEPKEEVERLRDQIRVRTHVYSMTVQARIGGGETEEELTRLRSELVKQIEVPLPVKPPEPSAFIVRPRHPAPTAAAVALDIEHISRRVSEAFGDILAFTNAGVFRAPRATRPQKDAARHDATAGETALVGVHFRESGIDWKVLDVRWCPADSTVVVWYFDTAMADERDVSDISMREFAAEGRNR